MALSLSSGRVWCSRLGTNTFLQRGMASISQGSSCRIGNDGSLLVPDRPIIPFIEGDGTGPDIWSSAQRVFDAAIEKAYGGQRKIIWKEVYAGEKSFRKSGEWLPSETLEAFREHLVGIKGPLTTPIGGGIRSLNVALRQELDLYTCCRPVRWFTGVPSPVKRPDLVNMVIMRENTEDIYAGIEFQLDSEDHAQFRTIFQEKFSTRSNCLVKINGTQVLLHQYQLRVTFQALSRFKKVRFPATAAYGIKAVSQEGTERIVKAAIDYALVNSRKSVTLVHKGNIMKFTEGAFRDWGYGLATREYREQVVTERESWIIGNKDDDHSLSIEDNAKAIEPGFDMMTDQQQKSVLKEVEDVLNSLYSSHGNGQYKKKLLIKDAIADIALQQVLTRPKDFDVIATLNLNGDYLSDALAAQVGGIGIAPGGNINYATGHAIFEATHGTAPKYANRDMVNPGSVILSGEMMLRHLRWTEAADLIIRGMEGAIGKKTVTYDFHRQMDGEAKLLACSEFGEAVVSNM